jgi:hypothetical protein
MISADYTIFGLIVSTLNNKNAAWIDQAALKCQDSSTG